jgi:NAD(P)H-hydrate epimerase
LAGAVVIDGVLGLGFDGVLAPDSDMHRALAEANGLRSRLIVAVDLPSGLDADRGDEQSVPLPADVTVTFGALKPVHVLAPCRDLCGEVVSLGIGFPRAAEDAAEEDHPPQFVLPEARELIRVSPWDDLPRSAHKYDRGHVLVIGGSPGKAGAPILAGLAALRAGAGWVTIAMPDAAALTLAGEVPAELTFEHLFDGDALNAINLEAFIEERKVAAVVAGPGTMVNPLTPEVLAVLRDFTETGDGFVVLDAAATHGMHARLAHAPGDPGKWLLTPHPGEWKKLGPAFDFTPLSPTGLERARGIGREMGVTLVYKGATPVVISGVDGMPGFVVTEGTLALARAGSGDVFAGVAGAHGAAGLPAVVAALRSQVAVAWAAILASESLGEHAVLATDVIASLGNITRMLDER